MFNLYQQLRSMVLGAPEEPDDSIKSAPTQPPSRLSSGPVREKQERYFTGTVTGLSNNSGMIDHQVFFEIDCVIGGRKPVVGSTVHVHAVREHPQAGWQARRVEVTSRWQPETESRIQVLIGYIAQLSPTHGVVDCSTEEVVFSTRDSIARGYRPHVNDWVQVALLHQDGQTEVNDLRPLREKSVTGSVTSVSSGFGVIEGEVYFTFSACARGYYPRVGDGVRVVCVEHRHHKNAWRAIHVEPTAPILNKTR